MIIPIVGASALEFWLSGVSAFPPNQFSTQNRKLVSLPEEYRIPYSQEIYRDISAKYHLSLPIHVMAKQYSGRKKGGSKYVCLQPQKMPEKSFIQIDKGIFISSPELCIFQMAKIFPLSKLVETVNILCADYSLDRNAIYGQKKRQSIATVDDIQSFIKRAKGLSGIKKTRQATSYAVNHAFSPMESKLAALSALPFSLGGYGLPKPELNREIELTNDAESMIGRHSCSCDLVWIKQKVIVEYDSNLSHLTPGQHAYDKRKYNALNMSGYHVFSITAENMKSIKDIEATFLNLRKLLGLRPQTSTLAQYESMRRNAVHAIIFDSWDKYL